MADNGLGVVGVAGRYAKVQIMALRFIGEDGGFESDALRALDYAVMMGAKVVVISGRSGASRGYCLGVALGPCADG